MLDLLGLLLLLLSAYCAGRLLPWPQRLTILERSLFAVGVGLAFLSYAYAILGLLQLYHKATVLVVVLLPLALWLRRDRGREARAAWQWLKEHGCSLRRGPAEIAPGVFWPLMAVLILMGALNLSEALLWDDCPDRYHVINARAYFNAGGFHCFRGVLTASYPLMVEMLYLPLFLFSPETVGTLMHCTFGLLTLPALYAFGRRFVSARAGLFAAVFYYGCSMVGKISPLAYNDLALAFYSTLTLCALAMYFDERRSFWIFLSGLLAGVAVSAKLLGVLYCLLPTGLVFLFVVGLDSKRPAGTWRWVFIAMFLSAAAYLPWLVKNGLHTGNPFFPLLTNVFPFDLLYGPALEGFHRQHSWVSARELQEPRRLIYQAYRIASHEGFTTTILLPVTLLYGLWCAGLRRVRYTLPALFSLFAFAAIVFLDQNRYRFYVPSLPPMALLAGLVLDDLLRRAKAARWMQAAIAIAMAAMIFYFQYLIPVGPWYRGHFFKMPPLAPSQRAALNRERDETAHVVRALNGRLNREDMLLFDSISLRRFRTLEIPFVPYSYFGPQLYRLFSETLGDEQGFIEPEALRRALKCEGITHLLVGPGGEERYLFEKKELWRCPEATLFEI